MKKLMMICAVGAAVMMTGCTTPSKMRDVEVKGMYVNGYSEVLAIGAGRVTSVPGEREAFVARYEEDTAWLSPNIKTHKVDIFLCGSNSVQSATGVVEAICRAFTEVAPGIAKTNAEVAKAGGVTPLDVVKAGGEVRKAVQTTKAAASMAKAAAGTGGAAPSPLADARSDGGVAAAECAGGVCTDAAACPGGVCTDAAACPGGVCAPTR